jgi:hypothetical protein
MQQTPSSTNKQKIEKVISVCSKKDAEVWEICHKKILANITANHYVVIVPQAEVSFFQSITSDPYEIISESCYSASLKDLRNHLPTGQMHQYGWYLQQLIKLAAIQEMGKDQIALIWDADTVPLQPLEFVNANNELIYYQGIEHHQPYFDCIKRLTELDKIVDFSFIAQCFPIKAEWLHAFFSSIEKRYSTTWDKAILSQIDFNQGNGFSEYETLGTYLSHKYQNHISYSKRPWQRLGNSLIGHPAFLDDYIQHNKPLKYDFISFEKWDRIKPYFFKVTIPYFVKFTLPKFLKKILSNKK